MEKNSLLEFKVCKGSLSQAYQESLVLNVLNFKTGGYFLEIGAADGIEASNTYLLEKKFNWTGLAVEWDPVLYARYRENRITKCVLDDATSWRPEKLMKELEFPTRVDYLQVDIDPADQSLTALVNLPFDLHRYSVVTFEHDYYVSRDKSVRDKSREFLRSFGYHLLVAGVETQGRNFEDWWIDPELEELRPLLGTHIKDIEAADLFID